MAEVAKCPKCGTSIDDTHENSWCTRCGEPLPVEIKSRLPKLAALTAASLAAGQKLDDSADVPGQTSGPLVVNRYRDAYRVGAALVGLGGAIKAIGAILAVIICLGSLSSGDSPFGVGGVVAGIFVAAIVAGLFWVNGVIVAAQGEILRATLDSAVAHSPFLNNLERLDAMGLPRSIADRAVVG